MSKKILIKVDFEEVICDEHDIKYISEEPEMFKKQMIEDLQRSLRFDYETLRVTDLEFVIVDGD